MKFKKIVGFGDSWMYGDEIIDPALLAQDPDAHSSWTQNQAYREQNCFLGLLGQHYNVPTENYGIPGGSLQSTVWKFLLWHLRDPNPQDALILIGLTEGDRFSHWNPDALTPDRKMVHSTWAQTGASEVPPDFRDMMKQQIVLTSCDTLRKFNYAQTVLLFDGMAARNSFNLIQFNIADAPCDVPNTPTLVEPEFSLTQWFVQEIQADYGRKYVKSNGHPNEMGHVLIRDRLISHIDSCIL